MKNTLKPFTARELRAWLDKNFDTAGCEPLVGELTELADRLHGVRASLAAEKDAKTRITLMALEVRLNSRFAACWKALGLADPPDQLKRPPGRPALGEGKRSWRD
jgi:hypothetical protein